MKEAGSDSEDSSLTPSLAEVSSDDLAWLDDRDPGEEDHLLPPASTPQLLTYSQHFSVRLHARRHDALAAGDTKQNTTWAPNTGVLTGLDL